MSQLLLSHRRSPFHRLQYRHSVSLRLRVGNFFLMFSMIILGGIMSFLYLMHYTQIHTKGYVLRKLEMEREALKTQQEIKTMNVSKVRSLTHIEGSERISRMVPLKNPIYLNEDTKLARKD